MQMSGLAFLAVLAVVACLALPAAQGERFLTFNTGLMLGLVPNALERADNINWALRRGAIPGVVAEALDVVCLQEVWLESHFQLLAQRLSPYFPVIARPPSGNGACGCSLDDIIKFTTCLTPCAVLGTDNEKLLCGMNCYQNVSMSLTAGCLGCVTTYLDAILQGKQRLDEILQGPCAPAMPITDRAEERAEQCYLFNGTSGTVLLSRHPLKEGTTIDYIALTNYAYNHQLIHAEITLPDLGDVHVFCAQTMPLNPANAELTAQLNGMQTVEIMSKVEEIAQNDKVILMGDFNASPQDLAHGIISSLPNSYQLFAGFSNAYLEHAKNPQCSYCSSNPFNAVAMRDLPPGAGLLTDHILTKNINGYVEADLLFTNTTLILDLQRQQAARVPYSNHYGVVAEISTQETTQSDAANLRPFAIASLFH